MRRVRLAGAVCMAALLLLGGCSKQDKDSETATNETTAQNQDETEYAVVETSYGNLYYAAAWGGPMEVTQSWSGYNLTVSFRTTIREIQYELFDIVIGQADGNPAGTLTDSEGVTRSVYAHMVSHEETVAQQGLTGEEANRLYSMQEELNTVLDHLDP